MESYSHTYENLKTEYIISEESRVCSSDDGRFFLIKRFPKEFRHTFEILLGIECDNLAKIFFIADIGMYIDVVFEYVSGAVLSDILETSRKLSVKRAKEICRDVCRGLCEMHRLNIIHRDINPNNIVITESGRAVIIDYGIARSVKADKSSDTVIMGTPGYAAPEQFGFTQSDARTDIYAVGVLFNVLLTGCLPSETIATGKEGRIIKKCIEIDAVNRYSSARELLRVLQGKRPENDSLSIFKNIPGFRGNNKATKIIATIVYCYLLIITLAMFRNAAGTPAGLRKSILNTIFVFFIPFVFYTDFYYISKRIPFLRRADPWVRRGVFIILGTASLLIYASFVR